MKKNIIIWTLAGLVLSLAFTACKKNDPKRWDIDYYKGLSALENDEYKELIQNPRIYYYELDDCALDELETWFGKDTLP